jgi:hypothetical protein
MTNVSKSKPPVVYFEDILCGPCALGSSTIALRAGPVELLFERETAWLRQVRIGERQMVRAIYGAVREGNWTTVSPVLKNLLMQQIDPQDRASDCLSLSAFDPSTIVSLRCYGLGRLEAEP